MQFISVEGIYVVVGIFDNTQEDGESTIGIFVETGINISSLVL